MRYGAIAIIGLVSGCTLVPETAPIMFKTSKASPGPLVDGVEISVLCELADKVGRPYLASDVDKAEVRRLEELRLNFNLLEIDDISCGRPEDTLDLPFVSDPQRQLVSTWGEFPSSHNGDVWGSCIADTSRKAGSRVVYCEISEIPDALVIEESLPETIETDTPKPDEPISKLGSKSESLPEDLRAMVEK